jgi:hypothetical protein
VSAFLEGHAGGLDVVRFVLFSAGDLQIYREVLADL